MERISTQSDLPFSFPYFRLFKVAKAESFFPSKFEFYIPHKFKPRELVFLFLLFCTSIAFSQPLQIDCNGNVGIGTSPVSTYKLKVANTSYFNTIISSQNISNYLTIYDQCFFPNGSYPGLIISNDPTPYGKVLYPSVNNSCKIGLPSQAFSEIWSYSGDISLSDKRQKENIKDITNALEKVKKLQGVNYDYKREVFISDSIKYSSKEIDRLEKSRKGQIGFLAQDVYEILPEVVVYDDSTDIYGITYSKVVPLLVEAIKEQQQQIETLKALLTAQEADLIGMKSSGTKSATIDNIGLEKGEGSVLYQNTPNPFNQSTEIKYHLAEGVTNAFITVCNLNGTLLNTVQLEQTGNGSISIARGALKPGIYLYTLVANGQMVDTKKMMITE
jgi:hypothetical protein